MSIFPVHSALMDLLNIRWWTQVIQHPNFIIIIWFMLSLIIFEVDLLLPLGVAGAVPYVAVILISLHSKHHHTTIIAAVICTTLTILGYFFSPDGGETWKVVLNRGVAILVIWSTAILALKIITQTEAELKVLKGLLPICSSCKQIRDEQGNWKQIESYIKQNSEADFSHSMCPSCIKEFYPNFQATP